VVGIIGGVLCVIFKRKGVTLDWSFSSGECIVNRRDTGGWTVDYCISIMIHELAGQYQMLADVEIPMH
jgi:hypothetical protein